MIALWLAWGCRAEVQPEGTSVGNPGEMTARVASTDGVGFVSAALPLDGLDFLSCSGERHGLPVPAELDLLASAPIELPDEAWCGLDLSPSGPLAVRGETATRRLSLDLEIGALKLNAPGGAPEAEAYVLELAAPGWLEGVSGKVTEGELHDALVAALRSGSAVYVDEDEDAEIDEEERASGQALAADEDEAGSASDTGASGDADTGELKDTGEPEDTDRPEDTDDDDDDTGEDTGEDTGDDKGGAGGGGGGGGGPGGGGGGDGGGPDDTGEPEDTGKPEDTGQPQDTDSSQAAR